MTSKATTVDEYIAELPEDRRAAIQAIRKVILKNLDKGFREGMQYGMIGYHVPHSIYPPGYHCDPKQPLPFAGLASQKNYMSIYLFGLYVESSEERKFRASWKKTGKKLDMGKSCVRFKKLDDVALDVIGETIARMTAREHIASYERSLAESSARRATKSSTQATTQTSARVASKNGTSTGRKRT